MESIRVYTGCYARCRGGNLISISANKGKSVGFSGQSYTKLAPKKTFWDIWHNNIGIIDEDENNEYYMHEYYKQVLANLDANEVLKELQRLGEDVVLLCFENESEFYHRHLVAIWLEKKLKIIVLEVSVTSDENFVFLERNQKYISQFNKVLDAYMNKRKE